MSRTDFAATDLFIFSELNKPKKLISKNDLKPINNLKIIFREIRDYFAGNVTGITRDEKIAENIMRLLFCKIFDEKTKNNKELMSFANRPNEQLDEFKIRIDNIFDEVKKKYPDIFQDNEEIEINSKDLSYIIAKMEDVSIINADRDVIADAFEELIGTSFRGGEGQFFTPRNVVQMMIDVLAPGSKEKILDPACGSGGFLAYILKYLIKSSARDYLLAGIDKDLFLSRLSKIYLALIGDNNYHVFCENSLEQPSCWAKETQEFITLESFDLILTNPPFGAKIPVVGDDLLKQYQLGHKWGGIKRGLVKSNKLFDKQPPQILFIERCLQLLKKGGRLGIVLPEGIFGNPSDKYIWEFINQNAKIIGVVSLSQETFQPSTHTKTSVLFLEKNAKHNNSCFMAIAEKIGHNKNGKEIYKINKDGSYVYGSEGNKIIDDDLPNITHNFKLYINRKLKEENHLGFKTESSDLNDYIFIPEYYNPEIGKELKKLEQTGEYELVSFGKLIGDKILSTRRGNEIGSQFYGTGDIPFVRTTDIVNLEIKMDPIKAVAEEIYEKYKKQQDIKENDILFVNDGTFLIGRTAIITRLDIKIIIQSHLRKIRILNNERITPFYLLFLLNTKIVQKQIISKTFTQATLSTLGNRLNEVVLPIISNKNKIEKISNEMKEIIEGKTKLREKSIKIFNSEL